VVGLDSKAYLSSSTRGGTTLSTPDLNQKLLDAISWIEAQRR
jgi:hypothetical protein